MMKALRVSNDKVIVSKIGGGTFRMVTSEQSRSKAVVTTSSSKSESDKYHDPYRGALVTKTESAKVFK